MSKIFDIVDKYKYGIIAAFTVYVAIFAYLQLETYSSILYYPIQPLSDGPQIEIPNEQVEIKPENIEIPEGFNPNNVKNISRDKNDTRKKSDENWDQNKSASQGEQSVKDYEKRLFSESSGAADRKRIQQEIDERNKQKALANSKPKETNNQSGGNTAFSGNVMVDWSLSNRTPHQNNNWFVRNPGYTCGHGSSGRVTVHIKVNQNGDPTIATYDPALSSGANSCMIEQALKYAKLSRFNYSSSSPKSQDGMITYTFISQ